MRQKQKASSYPLQKGPGATATCQLLVGILQCLIMRLGSLSLSGALLFSVPPSQHHVRGIFWTFFTLKLARVGEAG